MPEYKEAQKKLDQFSEQWQQEIDTKQAELDKMYRNFEAEQVMLSEELKKKGRRTVQQGKRTAGPAEKTLWF